jgi:hypothetical protein
MRRFSTIGGLAQQRLPRTAGARKARHERNQLQRVSDQLTFNL